MGAGRDGGEREREKESGSNSNGMKRAKD